MVSGWLYLEALKLSSKSRQYFCLTASFRLIQVLSHPTFTSKSDVLLDLIFVNEPRRVKTCFTFPPVADHSPTLFTLSFSDVKSAAAKSHGDIVCNYLRADFEGLGREFSWLAWKLLENKTDVNSAVETWYNLVFFSSFYQCLCQMSVFACWRSVGTVRISSSGTLTG